MSFLQRQMEEDDSLATYDPLKDKRGKDKVNYLDPLGLNKKEYLGAAGRSGVADYDRDRPPPRRDYRDDDRSRGRGGGYREDHDAQRDRGRDSGRFRERDRGRDRSRSRDRR